MFKINLKNLDSSSILKDGVYSQVIRRGSVYTGTIDRDLLKVVLKLNIALLTPLTDVSQSKNHTKLIISNLLNRIPGMVGERRFFGIEIDAVVKYLQKTFLSVTISDNVYQIFSMMRTYDETHQKMFLKIDEITKWDVDTLSDAKLQYLVDKLIKFNSMVLPRYTSSIYLCIITAFYAVFTKLDDSNKKSDTLILNIIFAHLQKILYDTSTDQLLLWYLGDKCCKNKYKFCDENGKFHMGEFYSFIKGKKAFTSAYTRLRLKPWLTKKDMINMYQASVDLSPLYNSDKLDPTLDLFPYIFHLALPRDERMREYARTKLIEAEKKIKERGIKDILKTLIDKFDKFYDHILFPNRTKVIKNQVPGTEDTGKILNPNNFSSNTELTDEIKSLLYKAIQKNAETIRKVCNEN